MSRRDRLALLMTACLLSACTKQMAIQPRYEPQGSSDFFDDHRVEREPIPGTVPSTVTADGADESTTPFEINKASLLRGQERFAISCALCHSRTGDGNGSIVQSGFKKPEALDSPALRKLRIEALVEIIRDGKGSMAGYRGLISPADMTAIAHYVRVLQLRKHVPSTLLSDKDRQDLGAAK